MALASDAARGSQSVLRAFGLTERGCVRPTNQDCFEIDHELSLCVVADGIGGHKAGEVAARLAARTIVEFLRGALGLAPEGSLQEHGGTTGDAFWPFGYDPSISNAANLLRTSVCLANAQVVEAAASIDEFAGMGTTIVAALVQGDTLAVAHAGDSRLYLFADRQVRQLTRDDSWLVSILADHPHADPMVLRHHPLGSALTNVIGAGPRVEVHVAEQTLYGGELLALTTDGVHGVIDDPWIERILRDEGDARQMAARLVGAALEAGSRDNCTAVIARYSPDPQP